MCFIDNNVLPFEFLQVAHAHTHTLKGGQADVELVRKQFVLKLVLSLLLRRYEVEHTDFRTPEFEFFLPVGDHSFWHDNKEIVFDLLVLPQKREERNSLDCLA